MPRHKRASRSPLNFRVFAKRTSNGQIPIVRGLQHENGVLASVWQALRNSARTRIAPKSLWRWGYTGRQTPAWKALHRLTACTNWAQIGASKHVFSFFVGWPFSDIGIHARLVEAIAGGELERAGLEVGARGRAGVGLGARACDGGRAISGPRAVADPHT